MEKNARYSETVKGVFRTYFFDFKQSEKGNPYLRITESRKSKEKEGEFEQDRIIILHKDLDDFAKALNNVIQHHKESKDAVASKE
ncbi:MAG: DUF3276 family protein [Phaeodactylibacter sp.]|nr:DUF3276 family protein [Phaeodactylibacter sp.]MCB9295261.1 DUF3276 family protein [Lewinellaceae bacterium]